MSGAKDLADMENIYKPAAECCTGIYVSIGILPGKVRRNSMKTKERVLDANLDPGRSQHPAYRDISQMKKVQI